MNKLTTRLNPRQERFCLEYVKTGNATQSAIAAGYSPDFARNNCPKLLQSKTIAQYIAELRAITTTSGIDEIIHRKKRLKAIYDSELPKYIKASDVVAAIKETNLMERVYAENAPREGETYNTIVFVMPDGTRVEPGQIVEGEVIKDATEQEETS